MNLHDDLRAKVTAAGFTMTAVCERADVSTGTPTHWAAGRTAPNQATYDKLIAALSKMVAERAECIKAAGIE